MARRLAVVAVTIVIWLVVVGVFLTVTGGVLSGGGDTGGGYFGPRVAVVELEGIILDVDDTPVEQPGDLQRLMISERIGRGIIIRIFRNGEILEKTAALVELKQ